jgi:O-antigen ligase
MGFVLSIFYLVTNYLTPVTLFGPLAAYRIELILAVLVLIVSLPKLSQSFILKTPQSLALIGLTFAAFMSVLIGQRWITGAAYTLQGFLPQLLAYFLVCLHCNTKKRLQALVVMLLFVCLFVIANGYIEQLQGISDIGSLQSGLIGRHYNLSALNEAGEMQYRMRGQGFLNDPNDFGQLIVCVIPLLFIFWRAKKMLRNIVFVILPLCILLFGAYLTHSRGALVGLVAVAVVAARRRIGTLPALVVAGGLFAAAMALHFTGGREISVDAGENRTALWGDGLQLLKSHPFFGVGAGSMPDYAGQTAHNSVVVCAAELGLFGLYFWALYLLATVRDALAIASPAKVSEGEPIVVEEERLFPQETEKIEIIDKTEINRLGRLMVLSLIGFLVTGWFLSRAFVMTFFLLGGMTEVVFEMALSRGMIAPRWPLKRLLPYAGVLAVGLVLLMYVSLLILNRMH